MTAEEVVIVFCKGKGSDAWFTLSHWLRDRDFLQGKQRSQCFNMGRIINNNIEPSVKLSVACMHNWLKAEELGWEIVKKE